MTNTPCNRTSAFGCHSYRKCARWSTLLVAILFLPAVGFRARKPSTHVSNPTRSAKSIRSVCETLTDYSAVDVSPIRSPLLVADHLIELTRGKTVFEVGTRNGDILSCVARFARTTYSAEIDPEYCRKLQGRGLNVYCSDFLTLNMSTLPQKPDVFFWWPMRADPQNEMWLSHVRSQASFVSSDCIVVIGFDHQWPPDMANRKEMLTKYLDAKEHIIEFDEGEAPRMRGYFSLVHFHI